jgi:pyruvate-formate lyase-activating enzyme
MEQLKHQLSETDACLLDLKQQQADIYRQLKLARKQLLKMVIVRVYKLEMID